MVSFGMDTYLFLGAAGFFAGFVDSIAGGGGLIALPALLSAGLPPHLALGTNKLQGSFGTFTATLNYMRNDLVELKKTISGVAFTAAGAGIGTLAVQHVPGDFLHFVIPFLLLAVFLYLVFSPELGAMDTNAKLTEPVFYGLGGVVLGFYDGFFGPGTGAFWMVGFVLLLGINLKKATAHTKVMNFTSNIVALVVFFKAGLVLVPVGIMMGMCQMLGAFAGSNLVVLKGTRFVRIFLLVVIAATIMKLMIATYFPDAVAG